MSFASDIRKYAEKQKRNIDEVVTESLINLSASVIIKTPVDTGYLANSWRASTESPSSSDIPYASKSDQDQNVEKNIKLTLDKGGSYYLVNNQHYARPIEYEGTSLKAPGGMLRVSIENYQRMIDNAIDQLN